MKPILEPDDDIFVSPGRTGSIGENRAQPGSCLAVSDRRPSVTGAGLEA